MKFSLFLVLLGFFIFPVQAFAAESIQHFDSHITIQRDASLKIEETIAYTTDREKHGIYRTLPDRYTRHGLSYKLQFEDISIVDDRGEEIPWDRSYQQGNVVLKIGDPDETFTGKKTYYLTYEVHGALQKMEKSYELYWDVVGDGWQIPIASSSGSIRSPYAKVLSQECFSGYFGNNDGLCRSQQLDDTLVHVQYNQPIALDKNLTVLMQLDTTGTLVYPSAFTRFRRQFVQNLVLLPLFLPGVVLSVWWWKKGRDSAFLSLNPYNDDPSQPQGIAPFLSARGVPMVYEPFHDLTPAEASALQNESVNMASVVAEILDLARQKLISITRQDSKVLLFTSTEYTLTKLKEVPAKLPEHQKFLMEQIFIEKKKVTLTEMKKYFPEHVVTFKTMVLQSLQDKKLFATHPGKQREKAAAVAAFLIIPTGVLMFMLLEQGIWIAALIWVLSSVLGGLAAYSLPARTALGHQKWWQVRGLRKTIQRGTWREKVNEKHLFIDEVLPFSVALGVVGQLTKDMKKLGIEEPKYLHSGLNSTSFSSGFVSSFTQQASSSFTINSNSSSWSSSSGGGFSGGGGGGGGGGSW